MMLDALKVEELINNKFNSVYKFCVVAKMEQSTVSRMLTYKFKTSKISTLSKMARALGVPIEDILLK